MLSAQRPHPRIHKDEAEALPDVKVACELVVADQEVCQGAVAACKAQVPWHLPCGVQCDSCSVYVV